MFCKLFNRPKTLSSLLLLFSMVFAIAYSANAQLRLPKVFSSNMVLQRNIPIKIWGWADKKEKLTIIFQGDTTLTKADKKGNWQAELKAYPAGGPFDLVIVGKEKITLSNILVGDVWICSGQSNMEWSLKNTNNAEEEIANATYPRIRLLTVEKNTSTTPLTDFSSTGWQICSPQSVPGFSAVGYFFGRKLNEDLDIPIGLIHTSWGGTNVETWISANAIEQVDGFAGISKELEEFDEASMIAKQREKVESITGPLPDKDQGMDGDNPLWAKPGTDFTSWKEMELPQLWESAGLEGLDGVIWFAHEFNLEHHEVLNDIEVDLGVIDDNEITWLNGTQIGATQGYNQPRTYKVSKDLLKEGRNLLVVRVEDTGGGGGMYGEAANMFVKLNDKKIALSGTWKYKIGRGDFNASVGPNSMPALLYNAMIHPLIPYGIKGAIWYQGESNADRAYQYRTTFPLMINNWRKDWGFGDFPFFFVQLANFMAPSDQPEQSAWAELREAQTLTLSLPNTGMATIIDIGEANDIHPRNKQDVGRRLALSALDVAYGKDVVSSGPTFKSMAVEGNRAMISFDNIGSGLYLKDKYGYVKGFAIAGKDKVFRWAKAEIMGDKVMVWSDQVAEPIAVRYAWANNPDDVNLYNMEGLPTVPFRTDDWPGITVDKKYR